MAFFVAVSTFAQLPGNVKGVRWWNRVELDQQGNAVFRYHSSGESVREYGARDRLSKPIWINHNPAMLFDGKTDSYTIAYTAKEARQLTLFYVYQPAEKSSDREMALWSLAGDSVSASVMTNLRFADTRSCEFINYQGGAASQPNIYFYTHRTGTSNTEAQSLTIGAVPQSLGKLPVSSLKGIVPEIIFYDRALSTRERQQVESYLAIKYGISLNQTYPTSYYGGRGQVIWDASHMAGYSKSIAAIGVDTLTGLRQLQSGAVEDKGLLEMRFDTPPRSGSYLAWSDDGAALTLQQRGASPKRLTRTWKVQASGDKMVASLLFDTRRIEEAVPLKKDEQLWLVVDNSGSNDFKLRDLSYYKALPTDEDGIKSAAAIKWDARVGVKGFTFYVAPPFFADLKNVAPTCSNEMSGRVDVRLVGGTAPYKLALLSRITGQVAKVCASTYDTLVALSGIAGGDYQLVASDNSGISYKVDVNLTPDAFPDFPQLGSVTVGKGEVKEVDASLLYPKGGALYQWTTPLGQTVASPKLAAGQTGIYKLTIGNDEGCTSTRQLEVKEDISSPFKDIRIFPNPTPTGIYSIYMVLTSSQHVTVLVNDLSGRVVDSHRFEGDSIYRYEGRLSLPGVYLVKIICNDYQTSFKVVVAN